MTTFASCFLLQPFLLKLLLFPLPRISRAAGLSAFAFTKFDAESAASRILVVVVIVVIVVVVHLAGGAAGGGGRRASWSKRR